MLSGPEMIKLALERGFVIERQKGSHIILSKDGKFTVIPVHAAAALESGGEIASTDRAFDRIPGLKRIT